MKTKAKTKTTARYGKVRTSFATKYDASKPSGVKAGRKVRGAITVGAATAVAGLGTLSSWVVGFGHGLFNK